MWEVKIQCTFTIILNKLIDHIFLLVFTLLLKVQNIMRNPSINGDKQIHQTKIWTLKLLKSTELNL